jgi:hypothetical protein
MENKVQPYWAQLDTGTKTLSTHKWAPQEQLQTLVNSLGDTTTEILHQAHTIALATCPTQLNTPSPGQHHQKRQTARLRNKYIRLRRRLKEANDPTTPNHTQPNPQEETLQHLAKQANPPPPTPTQAPPDPHSPPTPPSQWTPQLRRQVDQLIKGRLQNLDKQDASYVVQQHTKRLRKLAETKQKTGNKMMTGQYQQSTGHALRILKDGDRLLAEPAQIIQEVLHKHDRPP